MSVGPPALMWASFSSADMLEPEVLGTDIEPLPRAVAKALTRCGASGVGAEPALDVPGVGTSIRSKDATRT